MDREPSLAMCRDVLIECRRYLAGTREQLQTMRAERDALAERVERYEAFVEAAREAWEQGIWQGYVAARDAIDAGDGA